MRLTYASEAGGISEGKLATAVEDMDSTMTDCGSGGAGAGRRMVEIDGKGTHVKDSKKMRLMLCVSYFVSVFTLFLVRATSLPGLLCFQFCNIFLASGYLVKLESTSHHKCYIGD